MLNSSINQVSFL